MRAVVEYHESKVEIPPVQVMIAKGAADIAIKVNHVYILFWYTGSYRLDV